MATVNDWNAYIGVVQELAYVEDDLRGALSQDIETPGSDLAAQILFERFGIG